MTIAEFDHLEEKAKKDVLAKCCPSEKWVSLMLQALPAEDLVDLLELSEEKWYECSGEEWKDIFRKNARNDNSFPEYEKSFGFPFILASDGRSQDQVESILTARMKNDPEEELQLAAEEMNKIIRQRIEQVFQ